jgi:hypothetical protein
MEGHHLIMSRSPSQIISANTLYSLKSEKFWTGLQGAKIVCSEDVFSFPLRYARIVNGVLSVKKRLEVHDHLHIVHSGLLLPAFQESVKPSGMCG